MNNEQLAMPARNITYCPTAVCSLFTAHSTLAEIHSISNTAENGFEEFYFNKTSIENMQDAYERTPTNTSVKYNPFNEKTLNGEIRPPFIGLCHELLGHSYDADQGRFDHTKSLTGIPMYEVNACNVENVVRKYCGVNIRTTYAGKTLP